MPKYATPAAAIEGEYSKSDLETIIGLTRGEADLWPKRGIVSGHDTAPGSGRYRTYSFWNLVEATLAKRFSSGLGVQARQIDLILQGIREHLKRLGVPKGCSMEAFLMSDWTAFVTPHDDRPQVEFRYGGLGDGNFCPLVVTVSIGMVANELLDNILDDAEDSINGSQNWYLNAYYERRARSIGVKLLKHPMSANVLSRKKPDPRHPGTFNFVEPLVINKPNSLPISDESMAKIKAFIREELGAEQ